jgi:hypothetical protein
MKGGGHGPDFDSEDICDRGVIETQIEAEEESVALTLR